MTVNVDRMRRHQRSRLDLSWVRGPYPRADLSPVPVTRAQRPRVAAAQQRLGIMVDGELGPQTWCAITKGQVQ